MWSPEDAKDERVVAYLVGALTASANQSLRSFLFVCSRSSCPKLLKVLDDINISTRSSISYNLSVRTLGDPGREFSQGTPGVRDATDARPGGGGNGV